MHITWTTFVKNDASAPRAFLVKLEHNLTYTTVFHLKLKHNAHLN